MTHDIHLASRWASAGLLAVANASAFVFSTLTNDLNPTAIIAGTTMIAGAVLGSIKLLTPAIREAIASIGPALAELQKQREEIHRGSLTGQLEEMKESLLKLRERMHEVSNTANTAKLEHAVEQQVIKADLEAARCELAHMREENFRLIKLVASTAEDARDRAVRNTEAIDRNTESIGLLSCSAEFQATHPPPSSDPPKS